MSKWILTAMMVLAVVIITGVAVFYPQHHPQAQQLKDNTSYGYVYYG